MDNVVVAVLLLVDVAVVLSFVCLVLPRLRRNGVRLYPWVGWCIWLVCIPPWLLFAFSITDDFAVLPRLAFAAGGALAIGWFVWIIVLPGSAPGESDVPSREVAPGWGRVVSVVLAPLLILVLVIVLSIFFASSGDERVGYICALVAIVLLVWPIWLIAQDIYVRMRADTPGNPVRTLLSWGALIVYLSFLAWLTMTVTAAVSSVRESARRNTCGCHMCSIAHALHNYKWAHGRFPPAYSTDKDGRPLHSWRVLILPYIEEEQLYNKLHLNEPWNSPHNRAVFAANPMPRIFGCPSQQTDDEDDTKVTNYVMIVGSGTISDGRHSVRPAQITDGEANTILFVEMADSGIHWAEPRDLKADEMSYQINDPDKPSISSRHRGGAHVVFADGRYRLLMDDGADAASVRALTTIAGREDVSEFMEESAPRPVH